MSVGEEQVNLMLTPQQVQLVSKAVEDYIRKPAPFVKRQRILDGGATLIHVHSGPASRVSEISNWRVPAEGQRLVEVIRLAATATRPTDVQTQKIDAAIEVLLRTNNPDEFDYKEWGLPPPVDVIPNDEPTKLAELLKGNRPPWMDAAEANFLLEMLSKGCPESLRQN